MSRSVSPLDPSAPTPPRGNWTLDFLEMIGEGGFGAVYLARMREQDGLIRHVAVKLLRGSALHLPEVASRLRDEARLLAQVGHDHIVKVHRLIEVDGQPAVVMEYVEGADIADLTDGRPLPFRAALQVAAAVASALHAAYEAVSPETGQPLRAVHRDIKPSNVIVSTSGGVKLLDFGIAQARFDRETETGSLQFGTVQFMAPEMILSGDVGPAVDIYALGLVLCQMLLGKSAGRLPADPTVFPRARQALLSQLSREQGLGPQDASLLHLVGSMLSWHPDARPTAAQVEARCLSLLRGAAGEDLVIWARREVPTLIEHRRSQLRGRPLLGSVSEPGSLRTSPTINAPPPRTMPRTGQWLAIGAALSTSAASIGGLLLALLAVAWLLWQRTDPHAVASPVDPGPVAPLVVSPAPVAHPARAPTPEVEVPATSTNVGTTAPRAASGRSKEAPKTAPVIAPASKPTEAKVAVPTIPITLTSLPFGATVKIDGVRIQGVTPLLGQPVPKGEHVVSLSLGDRSITRTIRVSDNAASTYVWDPDLQRGLEWSSH